MSNIPSSKGAAPVPRPTSAPPLLLSFTTPLASPQASTPASPTGPLTGSLQVASTLVAPTALTASLPPSPPLPPSTRSGTASVGPLLILADTTHEAPPSTSSPLITPEVHDDGSRAPNDGHGENRDHDNDEHENEAFDTTARSLGTPAVPSICLSDNGESVDDGNDGDDESNANGDDDLWTSPSTPSLYNSDHSDAHHSLHRLSTIEPVTTEPETLVEMDAASDATSDTQLPASQHVDLLDSHPADADLPPTLNLIDMNPAEISLPPSRSSAYESYTLEVRLPPTPSNLSPASYVSTALVAPSLPDGVEENPLAEATEEVGELEEVYKAFRDGLATFSGAFEECIVRIDTALKSHTCRDALHVNERECDEVESLRAQLAQLTREKLEITSRPPQSDTKDAAELANLATELQELEDKYTAEIQQLSANNQQLEEDRNKYAAKGQQLEEDRDRLTSEIQNLTATLKQDGDKHKEELLVGKQLCRVLKRRLTRMIRQHTELELEHEDLQQEFATLNKAQGDADAFILVLIEGEARMFDPKLLAQGHDGGDQFAYMIRQQSEKMYRTLALGTKAPKVHIHMFMDLNRAIKEILAAGFVKNLEQLEAFLEGINQSDRLFVLSDVMGEFGASVKIRGEMASFGALSACKMIVLVAGSDRKYIREVDSWKKEGLAMANKLYAVRSTPELSKDPFASLGDAHLFLVQGLFPTTPADWQSLMAGAASKQQRMPRPGQELYPQSTGASVAAITQQPIQPNPALVPNYVMHANMTGREGFPDSHGQLGSPIPFTPMPTGVRYPQPAPSSTVDTTTRTPSPATARGGSGSHPTPQNTPQPAPRPPPQSTQPTSQPPSRIDALPPPPWQVVRGNSSASAKPSTAPPYTNQTSRPPWDAQRGNSANPSTTAPRAEFPSQPSFPALSQPPWEVHRGNSSTQPGPAAFSGTSSRPVINSNNERHPPVSSRPPPKRPRHSPIVLRGGRSIGGSPPSTDEDRPLDPTIPPAARMHVQRPPRFATGESGSGGRSMNSGPSPPPSGFRLYQGTSANAPSQNDARRAPFGGQDMTPAAKMHDWQSWGRK